MHTANASKEGIIQYYARPSWSNKAQKDLITSKKNQISCMNSLGVGSLQYSIGLNARKLIFQQAHNLNVNEYIPRELK